MPVQRAAAARTYRLHPVAQSVLESMVSGEGFPSFSDEVTAVTPHVQDKSPAFIFKTLFQFCVSMHLVQKKSWCLM
jgi:hypothetical protein